MAQSLEVNNKTYLPSVVLAKEFNYTPDYISKLAREEKVLGTRVGRQWFVEPESLRTFILQLEVEKRITKEDLSLERKRELIQMSGSEKAKPHTVEPAVIVGGKSVAVVLCGFILGSLMLFGYAEGLERHDLVSGSTFITHQLHQKIGTGFLALITKEPAQADAVANPLLSGSSPDITSVVPAPELQTPEVGIYTKFPDIVYATTSLPTEVDVAEEMEPELEALPFSDEVVFETLEGKSGVRPLFKDSEGQLYELSVTAIENEE